MHTDISVFGCIVFRKPLDTAAPGVLVFQDMAAMGYPESARSIGFVNACVDVPSGGSTFFDENLP